MFKRYLTLEEQQRLLSTVRKFGCHEARRDYGWMRLLRACGLRVGETSKLTTGQADAALQTGYLYIPREDRKGKHLDLTVRVTAEAHAALRDLLTVRQGMTGEQRPARNEPLILNRYGARMSVRSYQLRLEHWAREAGFTERVSPHWLRHTRAINIMRHSQAVDPRGIVKCVLGHASMKSTFIYTQPTKEDVDAALRTADLAVGSYRKRDIRRLHSSRVHA
jgi:site-specific recombinase XerD